MRATLKRPAKRSSAAAWNEIPPAIRVLYIASRRRNGGWLAEAFAADGARRAELEEVLGSQAGLIRLRDETFDAILVSHEPGDLDALALVQGYRASGADEPIIVLGIQSEQEMTAPCYEAGADGYVCANTTTTRNLTWVVSRAVQRHQLIRENRCLATAEQQRLHREHEEAERLLGQQRALMGGLEGIDLPQELVDHYRELLRTYVIMGAGNLAPELGRLAELLVRAGLSARETMHLHVRVLEELIHGMGSRSTRHVMTRADLLVLEVMIDLAELYRARYLERACPEVQKLLPGLEE